MVTIKV
jgi:hypothetical protein